MTLIAATLLSVLALLLVACGGGKAAAAGDAPPAVAEAAPPVERAVPGNAVAATPARSDHDSRPFTRPARSDHDSQPIPEPVPPAAGAVRVLPAPLPPPAAREARDATPPPSPEEPAAIQADPPAPSGPIAERISEELSLDALSVAARDFAESRSGVVAVAVVDLREGRVYTARTETVFSLASVAKVPLMLAVLDAAQQEGRALTDAESEALRLMITASDNAAADRLWRAVGGREPVVAVLEALSLGWPRFAIGEGPWGAQQADVLSVALLFAEIAQGTVLSPASRAIALQILSSVQPDQAWGITEGLTAHYGGAEVALKNGWFPDDEGSWRVHSAGFVRSRDGHALYALAILSEDQPSYAYGVRTVEGVAREIHRALAAPVYLPYAVAPSS